MNSKDIEDKVRDLCAISCELLALEARRSENIDELQALKAALDKRFEAMIDEIIPF